MLRYIATRDTKTTQSTVIAKILCLLTLNGFRKMESPLLPEILAELVVLRKYLMKT